MWFLGAGTSVTSGVPTANDLVWQFKRAIFCTEEKVPLVRCRDLSSLLLRSSIQDHFDRRVGFPPINSPDEYSFYFEYAYPNPAERRAFLHPFVSHAEPSHGHLVLSVLMKLGKVAIVWTTNFDKLVEDAASRAFGTTTALTVAELAHAELAADAVAESRLPLLVKLHGDFHHRRLKNIEIELRTQDEVLRRILIDSCDHRGLAVVGYSGRDESIMAALESAVEAGRRFDGGLYWLHRGEVAPPQRVEQLLKRAQERGVQGGSVRISGFDELLAEALLLVDVPTDCQQVLAAQRPLLSEAPVPSPGRGFPVLRLNALPVVEFPSQCRLVDCGIGGQQEVNEALEKSGENVLAARRSVGVLAFGTDAAVRRIFSSHGIRAFDLYPLDLASLASQPSEVSLLSDAITLAFARGRALTVSRRGRGRFLCADPAKETTRELQPLRSVVKELNGRVPGTELQWHEALRLRLEVRLERLWLIFEPTIWRSETKPTGDESEDALKNEREGRIAAVFISERLKTRYNQLAYNLIDAWLSILFGDQEHTTINALGIADGVDASFTIARLTAFSRPEIA